MAEVTDAPADLELRPLNGDAHTLREWLTTFHLVTAVLDPYTAESAWLLPTVGRILRVYDEADCRVAITLTCDEVGARQFLGPYAKEFLTFTDPDRSAVGALGLSTLPALVHIRQDLSIAGCAEGWAPDEWREVTERLSAAMKWSRPVIPALRDPAPYAGTPAAG
ncbi:MAG TPA: hypothetical protein VEA78_10725 [Acidimicrobiales bacterium]|nr:hypothetical protein [Acidimicrobiales bacterium]